MAEKFKPGDKVIVFEKPGVVYCQSGIGEEDLVADNFLFVYKDRENYVRITDLEWKRATRLIKELTGKKKYSIADAGKTIKYIRNGADSIYTCIGVKTVEKMSWH